MLYYKAELGKRPPRGKLFSTDTCETCEREVMAPNAVTLFPDDTGRLPASTYRWPADEPLPPEIWWDDELEQTICEREDCKQYLARLESLRNA